MVLYEGFTINLFYTQLTTTTKIVKITVIADILRSYNMKKISLGLIIGLLLCFCSGCCTNGRCPYCSTYLNYDRPMQPNEQLYCRECQSTFLITERCGVCPIDGQYDAERVKIAHQNQAIRARRASINTAATMMTLSQYYRGAFGVTPYQQPGYVQPTPPFNPWKQNDNYWQEERAFQEYQREIQKPLLDRYKKASEKWPNW